MYDYMKALQKRFDHQAHPELAEQVERAQEELRRNMDAAHSGIAQSGFFLFLNFSQPAVAL